MSERDLRILVVEDYPANQIVMTRYLEPYGDVDTADNGPDAVAKILDAIASGTSYDLICLDIMLPRMDGHEVLSRIRAAEKEKGIDVAGRTRVIMTSALGDSQNIMAAFRGECESYLQKPIRRERLEAELRELGLLADGADQA